jgi:hypothetical protein
VIEDVENGQALQQGVSSLDSHHEKASKYTTLGSSNKYSSSGLSSNIRIINSNLYEEKPTQIYINSSHNHNITTTPLRISHDNFDVWYDAGVITTKEDATQNTTVRSHPVSNTKAADGVLQLTTTKVVTEDGELAIGGPTARLYIEQARTSETVILSGGDTISVTTNTPNGWYEYLDQHGSLTVTSPQPSPTGGRQTVTAEADLSESEELLFQHQKVAVSEINE